jgi:hypothetical protein
MRNPINRLISIAGLVLLLPIGYLMVTGDLTPDQAGIRAAILLVAVVVVRRLARMGMGVVATSMERQAADLPHRRASDA